MSEDLARVQYEAYARMTLEMDRDLFFGPAGMRAAYAERPFRWLSWRERVRRLRCLWRGHRWVWERSRDDHPRRHWRLWCPSCTHEAGRVNDERAGK